MHQVRAVVGASANKRFLERALWLSLQYLLGQAPATSSAVSSLKPHNNRSGQHSSVLRYTLVAFRGFTWTLLNLRIPLLVKYLYGNTEAVTTEGMFQLCLFSSLLSTVVSTCMF